MDIRVISAVLMVAGMQGENAPSRAVGEVGKAHVVRSPVVMPAIMGDPKKWMRCRWCLPWLELKMARSLESVKGGVSGCAKR